MRSLILTAAALLSCCFSMAQRTLIQCGSLIDPGAGKVQREMTIIVEGNKVSEVRSGYVKAEGTDKLIDLRSKTVMPGLIDMHVHFEEEI